MKTLLLLAVLAPAEPPSIRDLDFFIGHWEGQSRFTPAFTPGARPVVEQVSADCDKILMDSHIQCTLRFRAGDGAQRQVLLIWRYSRDAGTFQGVVMDSSAWGTLTYDLRWDAAEGAWIGEVPAKTADGRSAIERLSYRPSADGRTIRNVEMLRPAGAAGWTPTFEFTWHRSPGRAAPE